MIIEKKVKFNGEYWLVKLIDEMTTEIYKYNEDGTVKQYPSHKYWGSKYMEDDLVLRCMNVVLKANECRIKPNQLQRINLWDGDMDRILLDNLLNK